MFQAFSRTTFISEDFQGHEFAAFKFKDPVFPGTYLRVGKQYCCHCGELWTIGDALGEHRHP